MVGWALLGHVGVGWVGGGRLRGAGQGGTRGVVRAVGAVWSLLTRTVSGGVLTVLETLGLVRVTVLGLEGVLVLGILREGRLPLLSVSLRAVTRATQPGPTTGVGPDTFQGKGRYRKDWYRRPSTPIVKESVSGSGNCMSVGIIHLRH